MRLTILIYMFQTDNVGRMQMKICFLCQCKFNSQRDLMQHICLNHPTEAELRYCFLCPKTYYTVEHLNEHLSRQHDVGSDCFGYLESSAHFLCPNGKKEVKCKICALEFHSIKGLGDHFSPSNPQNICAVQHSISNYSITNRKGFELHLEMDSETESEDARGKIEQGNILNTMKPYMCSLCNASTERKYQMFQHQRSMHSYESLNLKCEKCIFKTSCQVRQ